MFILRPLYLVPLLMLDLPFGASPARAIDCSTAQSDTEKAICADPTVLAADNAMSASYSAIEASLPKAAQKVLADNQSAWIESRDINCGTGDDGTKLSGAQLNQCLLGETTSRQRFLAGQPEEGPGGPDQIVPMVVEGVDGTFIESFHFAAPKTPGEKLFNALVGKELKLVHVAKNEDDYTDDFSMLLSYASPQLISAHIEGTDLKPTLAHPMPYARQINVDLTTGKALNFADAFAPQTLPALQQSCLPQVVAYTSPDGNSAIDQRVADVNAAVGDLSQWQFGATKATVAFYAYADEIHASCSFDYAKLRPMVKPGFPLPQ
jgi:uncharacterized protein YecT (DUF1311 family)